MSTVTSKLAHTTTTSKKAQVLEAIHGSDVKRLQELSFLPGGFGDAREQAWPFLLGVRLADSFEPINSVSKDLRHRDRDFSLSDSWTQPSESSTSTSSRISSAYLEDNVIDESLSHISSDDISITPHPDERQVQLDTDRSFVLYPVENHSLTSRKHLQHNLHDVILGVLRKRPKLRYFQGYHDIITVLFLTLPPETVLPSAEKLSLHRIRDSMGTGLEPLIGQLRILKRLLRLIDPSYAEILERNSPLPYYALSNLLTLFSHDVPTLALIQHFFDWILCREPVATIWLVAAVILARKEDILALEREGEEALGMMHAVLSALPALSESEVSSREAISRKPDVQGVSNASIPPKEVRDEGEEENTSVGSLTTPTDEGGGPDKMSSISLKADRPETEEKARPSTTQEEETAENGIKADASPPSSESMLNSWTVDSPRASSPPIVITPDESGPEPTSEKVSADILQVPDDKTEPKQETLLPTEMGYSRKHSRSPSRSRSHSRSLPGGYREKAPAAPLPLSTLLRQASELFAAYPPSSPALRLTETFGQQSALYSSATDLARPLNDEEAEAYVGGDNVVLPPSEEEQDEEFGQPRKPKEADRAPSRRKGRPIRLAKNVLVRKQTVVAGVVLLLGVAVALYGFGPGGRGASRNSHGYGRFANGEMRWMAAWVGGLLGVGQRLGVGL